MKKTLEMKFEEIMENYINGNISDYKNAIKRMRRKTLAQYIMFLQNNGYSNTLHKTMSYLSE
jgi:hypothetical protein